MEDSSLKQHTTGESKAPRYRWRILPRAGRDLFRQFHEVPPLIAQLLYNRGATGREQVRALLANGGFEMGDPFLLPGMAQAVDRICKALQQHETIGLFGDFDADGVTATAVLYHALKPLGARLLTYIPHRAEEGHGLNLSAVESLREQGAKLIITADCGISSFQEVQFAKTQGVDVVLVDHHTPPPELPPALAVLNPRLADSAYPYQHLASVGVAFKLAQALWSTLGRPWPETWLELVAIGTVADMAPLTGENHGLVKRGLAALQSTTRAGLRALLESASLLAERIDPEAISYVLAPRLNAAGRLDHANTSFRLLTTESPEEAASLAAQLERTNVERQQATEALMAVARPQALAQIAEGSPILLVGGADYPVGILGLVAGKLVEEFYRPAVVMRIEGEATRASARSIPEFNIISAFIQSRDLFLRFGGHPQAAGFTMPTARVETLQERLHRLAKQQLQGVALVPSLSIDAEVFLERLNGAVLRYLPMLAPYGYGNEPPTFLSRHVLVLEARPVGRQGEHLQMKVKAGPATWDAIGFGLGPLADSMTATVDMVYRFTIDHRGRMPLLKLNVLDMALQSETA